MNEDKMNDHDETEYGHADHDGDSDHEPAMDLERTLMVGSYRWSHPSTPALDDAMAAAQGEMRNAEQNRENTHLRSRYADLGAVVIAIREPMAKHKIARYQTPWTDRHDGRLYITTRLACGGQWVEADFRVPFEQLKGLREIQSVGNAITYVKRYALTSMAGIASGEDDDGESGSPSEPPRDHMARWQIAVAAFAELNVGAPVLLAYCRKNSAIDLDEDDHGKLERLCNALRRGDSKAHDVINKARASIEG